MTSKIRTLAQHSKLDRKIHQRPLAQSDTFTNCPSWGQRGEFGLVNNTLAGPDFLCPSDQFLIPEHVCDATHLQYDIRYYSFTKSAKSVMAAQDTRRFILGFTLWNSTMAVWKFSRLSSIFSDSFDINVQGQRFVRTILGFMCLNDEELGFDPTIQWIDGKKCIDIVRNDRNERIVRGKVLTRHEALGSRGTTCWEAYSEDFPSKPLVVKDSWQQPSPFEEGELLQKATESKVINVVQYYHYSTVHLGGKEDDVANNFWGGAGIPTPMGVEKQRLQSRINAVTVINPIFSSKNLP